MHPKWEDLVRITPGGQFYEGVDKYTLGAPIFKRAKVGVKTAITGKVPKKKKVVVLHKIDTAAENQERANIWRLQQERRARNQAARTRGAGYGLRIPGQD